MTPVEPNTYMEQRMADREQQWRQWMLAERNGDKAAYKMLLADLSTYLRGLARRSAASSGLSHSDVEDIVQETLLAVHLKRHTWNEGERFGPWVRAITRYKLIDAVRRRGGRFDLPIDDYAEIIPAQDQEQQLPVSDIVRMASTLPEKQRTVVMSLFVDGHSTAETATRLEMTEGAVRVTLHRALGALAKRFGEQN